MASIKEYKVISCLNDNHIEAIVGAQVTVVDDSGTIIDDLALRLWIEGENSLGEPIQIVLDENLHIDVESITTLEGTLFNPILSTSDKPYNYRCRLQLIDENDNILEEERFILSVSYNN